MVVNLGIGYSICTTGITITEVAHYVMVCILGCVGKLDSCSRLLWANRILRGLLWTPGLGLKTQSLNWNHFMLKIFRISPCRATATAVCFMNRKSCHFALCFVYRIGLPLSNKLCVFNFWRASVTFDFLDSVYFVYPPLCLLFEEEQY